MLNFRVISLLCVGFFISANSFAYGEGAYGYGDDREHRGPGAPGSGSTRERICRDPNNRFSEICRGPGLDPYHPAPQDPYYPAPQNPYYPAPQDPYNPPGRCDDRDDRLVTMSGFVGRDVFSESFELRNLIQAGFDLQDAIVENVTVDVRSRDYSTQVQLIGSQGEVLDSQASYGGSLQLRTGYQSRLSNYGRGMQLRVTGRAYVGSVTVALRVNRRDGNCDNGPIWGPVVDNVSVYLGRQVYQYDRIDLSAYVDQYRYRGYVVEAVDIEASSASRQGHIYLLQNITQVGQAFIGSPFIQNYTVFLNQSAGIGYDSRGLVLEARGQMLLNKITLRLRRL